MSFRVQKATFGAAQMRPPAGVVAGGGGDLVDLCEPGVGRGVAGGRQAAGLVDLAGGVVLLGDQAVVFGVPVEAGVGRPTARPPGSSRCVPYAFRVPSVTAADTTGT
jgi:hypothetical protein